MKQDSNNSQSSGNSQPGVEKNLKNITKPKLSLPLLAEDKVVMLEADLQKGYTLTELLEDKDSKYQISSYKFYKLLKENPELDRRVTEARKIGIQTLIDRLLQIFNTQQLENPNLILSPDVTYRILYIGYGNSNSITCSNINNYDYDSSLFLNLQTHKTSDITVYYSIPEAYTVEVTNTIPNFSDNVDHQHIFSFSAVNNLLLIGL